ncbi:MAG: HAD family hydrolase [Gammaproteobacteria bacterium]|nr:MAG: HAD family hydrolase [Gammaproteobacteria bacterium]
MKLVVFDLFGTLVQHQVRHSPYRQLIKYGQAQGRRVRDTDAREIMSLNVDIVGIAKHFEIDVPPAFLDELQCQIDEELSMMTLFDDVLGTIAVLNESNIPMAICSNLAMPYGVAIDDLLGEFQFSKFLSYEMGCIKPDQQIYRKICETTHVSAKETLFVGDNLICDYIGPSNFGFHARHLNRHGGCSGITVKNLNHVLSIVSGR